MKRNSTPVCAAGLVALTILSLGCQSSPQVREARYLRRGITLAAKKEYARAILEFRNATNVMPTAAEPFYQLGLASLASGSSLNGVIALRRAVELDPKHAGAQLKLAELMSTSRDEDVLCDAAQRLESVLAVSPDNLDATNTLALAEWRLGRMDDASRRLTETPFC